MLALIYLATAIYLGDRICRRFYRFVSIPHRWAASIIVGLLVSSWFTYLAALTFASASQPLLWGNFLFFVAAIVVLSWPRWKNKIIKAGQSKTESQVAADLYLRRPGGSDKADWLLISAYFAFACWMMFASLNSSGGKLQIANNEYSDFGPNTAIMQSFAVGHNFPTEYPPFSGDRIRYHFLFYFQAGNLEFLGLDPAWSLNLLSILSLVAMLTLTMVLGEALFNSRAVGRVGSALFFFFGSLSYIPFLHKQTSVRAAIEAIRSRKDFLPSIFPYRGELWGVWSQVTYLNQRHLASAIGVLLLVLIFLVLCYRGFFAKRPAPRSSSEIVGPEPRASPETSEHAPAAGLTQRESAPAAVGETAAVATASGGEMPVIPTTTEPSKPATIWAERFRVTAPGFIFSGVLLGLLPMWNSAVFIAGVAVLASLFILCPLRPQMLALAMASGVIALPQIIYLRAGSGRRPAPQLIHWGYTLDHPTVWNVAKYLGFTFGFKWLLVALALVFATALQRRILVAVSSLVVMAFLFQFTVEALANQKFLHIWIIIVNLFIAYGLSRLWGFKLLGSTAPGRFSAIVVLIMVIPGGIIDCFPIHNAYWSEVTYRNDPLIEWLNKETKPRDILLTDRFVTHPILMAGRRVFYGWPYYGWSAGYDASERDRVYRELFETRDPWKMFRLLKENNISYVAFDNAVRHGDFIKRPNEEIYAKYFPKVFEDKENRYNSLAIYKVPDKTPPQFSSLPEFAVTMFEGGKGTAPGQFDSPRGIAADSNGNILVADTNNGRIEKFSSRGVFITSIGMKGTGYGQLGEPNGIAIDRAGNIYVAEASNHRVQKLTSDGIFITEWKGPEPGFYGPRRIAIGPDDAVYVVDQGRTRIVKFSPDGQVLANWGRKGNGDGEFDDPTSVAVDPTTNNVYVADPTNKRVQVFDSNGKFLNKWSIPEWHQLYGLEDLAIDSKVGRLYASSANMDAVLVFDLNGTRIGSLRPKPPDKLEGPSALALVNGNLFVLSMFGNHVSEINPQTK
jgi:DNA-binding beta-propeller fold protein YncE